MPRVLPRVRRPRPFRAGIFGLLAAALLLGSESRFACGTRSGFGPAEEIRSVELFPDEVVLAVGDTVLVEGVGRDRRGRVVEVRLEWRSDDPEVAAVSRRAGESTAIRGRSEGFTFVRGIHPPSGARNVVAVEVTRGRPSASR